MKTKTVVSGAVAAAVVGVAIALAPSPKWKDRGQCLSNSPDPTECHKMFPSKKASTKGTPWWIKDAGK